MVIINSMDGEYQNKIVNINSMDGKYQNKMVNIRINGKLIVW